MDSAEIRVIVATTVNICWKYVVGLDLSVDRKSAALAYEAGTIREVLQPLADKTEKIRPIGIEGLRRSTHYLLRARMAQLALFPEFVLHYPTWDIMVMCFLAELEDRRICVKQIRCDVRESSTALLRRIDELEQAGLVRRDRDEVDARRTVIRLTPHGNEAMLHFVGDYVPQPD